jgi:hypothetical protein
MSGTTYTPQLRLIEPGINVAATKNAWGALLNTDMALIESAITGTVSVDLSAGGTITLSANSGAADQSRPYGLLLIGTPSAAVQVNLPTVVKFGLVQNQTGESVTMSAGGTTSLTLSGGATSWTPYYCDGANVSQAFATPGRGSTINSVQSGANVNWSPPIGVTLIKATLDGHGGTGGIGTAGASNATGGGGGGGGAGIVAFIPVSATDTFTLSTEYIGVVGCAALLSFAGDVILSAGPGVNGSAGTGLGPGGAGGGVTNNSTRAGMNVLEFNGCAGAPGYYAGTTSIGGQGGNSGNGAAGVPAQAAYYTNVTPSVGSNTWGVGGAGGAGSSAAGSVGGFCRVLLEW